MRQEVQEVVNQFDIQTVKSADEAGAIINNASDKYYSCIITGKLTKAGDDKYFAVCTLKTPLTNEQKTELARLYLETVVLHSAIRERLVPKTLAGTHSKKRKGIF